MAIRAFARASQFLYTITFHFHGGSDANTNIHLPSRDSPSPSSQLSGIGNHEFNDPIVSPSFESFIQSTMTEFHSPALSIAFMSENQTWARGFGYSSLPANSSSSSNSSLAVPVTPRTLFSTGSTTKSQVAATLALLISSSSNNLTWSTPVSSILPPDIFSLADEWSTSHITLIDILSHRTGYPRYDIGVLGTNVNETIHRMRYLRPSAEPRTKWQYSNEMYTVAGKVVEILSGMELGIFLREKLWGPLGMTGTRLGLSPVDGNGRRKEDFANEYFWNNDTEKFEGPLRRTEVTGEEGAGAVVSSVVDYMAYLRGMMGIQGSGRSNNNNTEQQGLGDEARAALLGTHMFLSDRAINENREFLTGPSWYGLGWSGDYVLGELAWHHNGAVGQMRTDLWFFPRLKKGFAVMQSATSPAIDVVANEAIYEILGTPREERLPWAERFKEAAAQAAMTIAQIPRIIYPEEFTDPAPPKTPPSWSLADLVGKYRNPGFVDINLSLFCNSTSRVSAPGSPAHPTRDEKGCFLQTNIINTASGHSGAELENVNGDKWLGWAFLVDMPASYSRPFSAIKVVFEGDQGRVTRGNFLLRTDTVTVLESFEKVE